MSESTTSNTDVDTSLRLSLPLRTASAILKSICCDFDFAGIDISLFHTLIISKKKIHRKLPMDDLILKILFPILFRFGFTLFF